MKRTLNIKGRTGTYDAPSFLLSENEDLQIAFNFKDEIRVGRFRVVAKHGSAGKRTYTLKKGEAITLPAAWLKAGGTEHVELSLAFLNVAETAVVKSDYQIEPLKVESIDGDFAFTATVQELFTRQATQEEKLIALEKRVTEYETNGVELTPEE